MKLCTTHHPYTPALLFPAFIILPAIHFISHQIIEDHYENVRYLGVINETRFKIFILECRFRIQMGKTKSEWPPMILDSTFGMTSSLKGVAHSHPFIDDCEAANLSMHREKVGLQLERHEPHLNSADSIPTESLSNNYQLQMSYGLILTCKLQQTEAGTLPKLHANCWRLSLGGCNRGWN